jgi:hypothetical protein
LAEGFEQQEAVYTLDGAVAQPSAYAAGPWDPGLQHGGPSSALIATIVDALPAQAPMQLTRLSVDLMRPAPIAPMDISTRIVRDGRNIQLVEAIITIDGKECVRASALRMRTATLNAAIAPRPVNAPPPEQCPPNEGSIIPVSVKSFSNIMEMRVARGDTWRGPSAMWFRMRAPLIAGRPLTPLMHTLAAADFCNGVSATLPFAQWTFVNGDLTVHLARAPVGEWILLDAETWLGDGGRGVAFGLLGDERGYFGRAAQSLVIAPRG